MNILIILSALFLFSNTGQVNNPHKKERIIIDSHIKLEEALMGKEIPNPNTKNLRIIDVEYYSFDNRLHRGQVVIHKDLAEDIKEIFTLIKEKKFPIKKVVPINK